MRAFIGPGLMPPVPAFMDKLTPKDKAAFANRRNLPFSNPNYKFQNKYPVTRKAKALVYGSSYPYQRNLYGAAADVYPSSRQYQAQLSGKEGHFAKGQARRVLMRNKFPKKFTNVFRWRRACERDKKGKPCPWKWVLEKRAKKCAWPVCARYKKNHWNHKLEDPLEKQLLNGAVNGRADPFGFGNELGDEEDAASEVEFDSRLRSHMRANGGEPVGDALINGWQMANGIDWAAPTPGAEGSDEGEGDDDGKDESEEADE